MYVWQQLHQNDCKWTAAAGQNKVPSIKQTKYLKDTNGALQMQPLNVVSYVKWIKICLSLYYKNSIHLYLTNIYFILIIILLLQKQAWSLVASIGWKQ